MTEQAGGPVYSYRSDAEFEADWIAEHRGHRVVADTRNWLMCKTCGIPLKLTTMDAYAVVRELS